MPTALAGSPFFDRIHAPSYPLPQQLMRKPDIHPATWNS